MDSITYEVFIPEKSEQDPIITPSVTAYAPPICLDDGTILTHFHGGFENNGKTPNPNLSLNPDGAAYRYIHCSFVQRYMVAGSIVERIFVYASYYPPDVTSKVPYTLYYSTDKGDTWSSDTLTWASQVSCMYVIGETVHIFDIQSGTVYYYVHTVGTSGCTLIDTYGLGFVAYLSTPIRYDKYLVIMAKGEVVGWEIGTNNRVALSHYLPDSLEVLSTSPHSAVILGKFPNIYVPLSSDGSASSTSTKYLYKLVSYGTTYDSWVFEFFRILPRYVILSNCNDEYSYISNYAGGEYRVFRLDHITGAVYSVYKSEDPIQMICSTQIPSTPFVLTDSGSQWYKHVPNDISNSLNECKSYHYINAIASSGKITFPKTMLPEFDRVNKCVLDFYTKSNKYHPAYFDFRDIDIGDSPTIPEVTFYNYDSYKMVESLYNHSNVLWVYEDVAAASLPMGLIEFFVMPNGTTTFTHGTISFFFGGVGDFDSTVRDHRFYFKGASSEFILYFLTKTDGIHYYDTTTATHPIGEGLNYFEIDFDGRTGGGYKGLSQYSINVRINGVYYESNVSIKSSPFYIESFYFNGFTDHPSAEKYYHYIDAVTCTGRGEHPLRNYTKGDLRFRGYLEKIEWKDYILTANFTGIDKELDSNSTSIETKYRNSKDLMEAIIDNNMKQISHYQSIDPNEDYNTDRIMDYSSTSYTTVIDEIGDIEDGIEYRQPNGRMWMRKITDMFDTTKVISTTSDIKIIQCDWSLGTSEDVNRVVVYGSKYVDADGNIQQVIGIDEDEISVGMDGIHEVIYRRSACKTNDQATSVAVNIRKRFGSLLSNPYKLINVTLKSDWFQVGTLLNFEYDVKDVENADRIILSQEYDYKSEWTSLEICESVIQNEDLARMQQLRDTQRNFTNEFMDTNIVMSGYTATDRILFKNSIASIQHGVFEATPVIAKSPHYKVAAGILGKDWVIGDDITDYDNWTSTAATHEIIDDSDHGSTVKIINSSASTYTRLAIESLSTGNIEMWVKVNVGTSSNNLRLGFITSALADVMYVDFNYQSSSLCYFDVDETGYDDAYGLFHDLWYHLRFEIISTTQVILYVNSTPVWTKTRLSTADIAYIEVVSNSATTSTMYISDIGISKYGYVQYSNYHKGGIVASGSCNEEGYLANGIRFINMAVDPYGATNDFWITLSDFPDIHTHDSGGPAEHYGTKIPAQVELPSFMPDNVKGVIFKITSLTASGSAAAHIRFYGSPISHRYLITRSVGNGGCDHDIILSVYNHKLYYERMHYINPTSDIIDINGYFVAYFL